MFKPHCIFKFLLILAIVLPCLSYSGDDGIVAWWKFDSLSKLENINPLTRKGRPAPEIERIFSVTDVVSGIKDHVQGSFFQLVPGVIGNAIQLDGNTSFIQRQIEKAPHFTGDFSAEAWIALGAFPTNWCPVIDHSRVMEKGFFLGINAQGQVGFKIKAGGKWWEVISDTRVALRKWTHIAAIYSRQNGITLYLNGIPVSSLIIEGLYEPAINADLLIGKHSIKMRPVGTIRPNGTAPVFTFLDGLLDEIKLYNRALTASEIESRYQEYRTQSIPPLSARILPTGPEGRDKFGAVYTTLKYYQAWDALWPVRDKADVVVKFDEIDGRFIFWRGTSYIPHWVTENGIWYNNEFCETWSDFGGHEPMSDKRCEYSHVRIIENNDSRVVVHWRYALVDNWYNMVRVDSLTGWGEWADEIYTIYPDGVAVREITLHSTQPQSPHEWHEGIVVMGPGQRPEQVLEPGALTLANMTGEAHTFSWEHGIPAEAGEMGLVHVPNNANIHVINTKSKFKPFVIVSPEMNPDWEIFSNEFRRDVSMFPWWNHWPAALKGSDGRYAQDSDLASHSSLSNCHWDAYRISDKSVTKIMLNGLTQQTVDQLVLLAASWSYPPALSIKSGKGFNNLGYDPATRSYMINYNRHDIPQILKFELDASKKSPVVNPAFVIKNYGISDAELIINGKRVKKGKNFRLGCNDTLESSDIIVWVKFESDRPVNITLLPVN
jgi:hypothetical protein